MRPTIHMLDTQLIQRILDEALAILAGVGMEIRGQRLRARLLAAGLIQDADSHRILFPQDVVMRAIDTAPPSFSLYDRAGDEFAVLGGQRVHFVPGSSGLNVVDRHSGHYRRASTADFVEYVWVAANLPHIAYLATAFSTTDVDQRIADAWRLYLCLTQASKPVVSGSFTEHGVMRMAEMMEVFRRDQADLAARPMSIFTVTASGNFRYGEDSCQNLLDCAEWGIPVEIVPVTLMGLVAPVTLVGAAVFHTVDVLAGVTMAQLIRPGLPVLFGGAPAAFHMRESTSPMVAIEALRLDVAYAGIGQYLGLPTQSYMAISEGKFLDAQAGAETFGSALLAALAGVSSVSGPGMLDYTSAFSLPKLVFDDEVCGQALHFVGSTSPVEDLPTLELVQALLNEDHMLTASHTLRHWPTQFHMPSPVIDRQSWDGWTRDGQRSLQQRAQQEVERYLAAHSVPDLDQAADVELRRILLSGLGDHVSLPPVPLPAVKPQPATRQRRGNRRRS